MLFYLNLATLITKVPMVYFLGTYYHVMGIAVAFLVATFINLVINFVIVQYLIGDFMNSFLRNLAKPLLFCIIMVGVVAVYKSVFGYEGIANMIAEVLVGGATYGVLTLAFKLSLNEIMAYRQSLS